MRTIALLAVLVVSGAAWGQDMRLSQVLIAGEWWREVKLPQGKPAAVTADAAGHLFVAEAGTKRIWKVDKDGRAGLFATASANVGRLACDKTGKLIAALPAEKRLVAFDSMGRESTLAEKVAADDVAISPTGRVVTLDAAHNSVMLVGRDKPIAVDVGEPSALVFWKDGGTLVVGDSGGKHLFAFRVKEDGGLDSKEGYYTLRVRPGQASKVAALVIDDARRLFAATRSGVQVFDPTGRLSGVLNSPERAPVTALALAGPERAHLYIVCAGKLWQRKTKSKGAWPPPSK